MNTKKQIFLSSISIFCLLATFSVNSVLAQEPATKNSREEQRQTTRETLQQKNLDLKKTNAYKEIDRRVISLESLIEKVNQVKRLTQTQKTTLVSQVQSEIDSLKELRIKIASDTDLDTLKADKQKIVQSYRIYALFLPKITILSHADSLLNLVDLLKTKSKDNTDANTKIALAETKIQQAINTVVVLTPDNYPANKTQLKEAKNLLESARLDLNSARTLINKAK